MIVVDWLLVRLRLQSRVVVGEFWSFSWTAHREGLCSHVCTCLSRGSCGVRTCVVCCFALAGLPFTRTVVFSRGSVGYSLKRLFTVIFVLT